MLPIRTEVTVPVRTCWTETRGTSLSARQTPPRAPAKNSVWALRSGSESVILGWLWGRGCHQKSLVTMMGPAGRPACGNDCWAAGREGRSWGLVRPGQNWLCPWLKPSGSQFTPLYNGARDSACRMLSGPFHSAETPGTTLAPLPSQDVVAGEPTRRPTPLCHPEGH